MENNGEIKTEYTTNLTGQSGQLDICDYCHKVYLNLEVFHVLIKYVPYAFLEEFLY